MPLCAKYVSSLTLSSFVLCAIGVVSPPRAWARECTSGGQIIFRDTLYGIGTGIIIGGLVLVAKNQSSDVASSLATAGLIGAGVGGTLGIVEMSLSDCIGQSSRLHQSIPGGWQPVQPFLSAEGWGFRMSYVPMD